MFCMACNFCRNPDMFYWVMGTWPSSVRIYAYVSRHLAVFNICCRCECQRLLVSCFFFFPFDFGFKLLFSEYASCSFLSCSPLLLYWNPVGGMVRYVGGGSSIGLTIKFTWARYYGKIWRNFFDQPSIMLWLHLFQGPLSQGFNLHNGLFLH